MAFVRKAWPVESRQAIAQPLTGTINDVAIATKPKWSGVRSLPKTATDPNR